LKILKFSAIFPTIRHILANEIKRLRKTEHTFMVVVAVIIGVAGGFGAVFFRFAIRFFQGLFFGSWHYTLDYVLGLPWYIKLFAPTLGGLVVGPIVYHFAREAKGHGVPEVMESIVKHAGAIHPRVMIAKVTASAVSIGSGGSVGREGPIVQIGSAIGSAIGQVLRVTGPRLRTLVACGTAAGIAGTFNAPIAGALFAMEIILSDFGISQFSPIVISSVSATVISRHFLGDFPAFVIPKYQLVSVFEMIPYGILGILAAFLALAFINMLYKTEDLFEILRIPRFLKPALGGLCIGAIGIYFPHIFGVGYETIDLSLQSSLAWYLLLLFIGLKLVATSVTIGSGGSGGIFAPSLFLGASLGGFVGTVIHSLMPASTASPGAYALVGMGAVAAGAMHAPITSILIIFELSDDYRIILPLMIACIISVLITTRLKRDSIYTHKLSRRGLHLFRGREVNVLRSLKVSQVMGTDCVRISLNTPFHQIMDLTVKSPHSDFFVVDKDGHLSGVVSIHDVRKILYQTEDLNSLAVAYDLLNPIHHYFTPEDTLDIIMKAFSELNIDELPVVNNEHERIFIGTISKHDVIEIYNNEMLKRDTVSSVSSYISSSHKLNHVQLIDGQVMSEIEIPSEFIDKTLRELNLRNRFNVVVVLIKQKSDKKEDKKDMVFPNPDYRFKSGDSILILGSPGGLKNFTSNKTD
jgi:CIC family chloride channel protein